MTPDEAVARFKAERPRFERAAQSVASAVSSSARAIDVTGRVTSRVKEVESYRGKLAIKSYSDPWADVTDKCGVRMILERDTDVSALYAALVRSDRVDVISHEDKRQIQDPSKLEYTGVHLQVVADGEPTDTDPIQCEVQLRTAAQDLWSVVSHSLLYKPTVPLPATEQHAVYRLVALTELFDLEVERIMTVIPTLPGYELSPLLKFLESEFAGIAGSVGKKALSVSVLDGIKALVPDVDAYLPQLAQFTSESREDLRSLYNQHGPGSEMSADFDYTLFSQPESLILVHLLTSQPMALEAAWAVAGMPRQWLSTLAALAGVPLNEI